jgi:DNA-binding NarL/FixJ family response regulator
MLVYTQGETLATRGRKVVICDDHPQMRGGLRNVLTGMLGCDVVAETASGEEAIELVERHRPHLLVLDLSLAGKLNGHDVLNELHRRHLTVKVFVHTAFLNRDDFEEWIDGIGSSGGPDGIDEKGTGDMELAIGFTQVLLTDQNYVPLRLIKKFGSREYGKALDRLTPREVQILKLAVRPEADTRAIAKQLGYSASTVRSYLTTIYSKLGLEQHTRAALMAFYYDHRDEILP